MATLFKTKVPQAPDPVTIPDESDIKAVRKRRGGVASKGTDRQSGRTDTGREYSRGTLG